MYLISKAIPQKNSFVDNYIIGTIMEDDPNYNFNVNAINIPFIWYLK